MITTSYLFGEKDVETGYSTQRNTNQRCKAAERLSQQYELLDDLIDDEDDDDDSSPSEKILTVSSSQPYRIPPKNSEQNLQQAIPYSLLQYSLSFLGCAGDLLSVLKVNKYFAFVADADFLWFAVRNQFMKAVPPRTIHNDNPLVVAPVVTTVQPQLPWVCSLCHLTQALASSTFCEMCGMERPPPPTNNINNVSVTAHILVHSTEHLAALWSEGRKEAKSKEEIYKSQLQSMTIDSNELVGGTEDGGTSAVDDHPPTSSTSMLQRKQTEPEDWGFHMGSSPLLQILHRGGEKNTTASVITGSKWYFQCKMVCLEAEQQQKWDCSLHKGWVWIRDDLRTKLREKWVEVMEQNASYGDLVGSVITLDASSSSSSSSSSSHTPLVSASSSGDIQSEARLLQQKNEACFTLRKALAKLGRLNWVLTYESLKSEFNLQSEALARDMKDYWSGLPSGSSDEINNAQLFLSRLCQLCIVYISWVDIVEENGYVLNDQISRDRERNREIRGGIFYSTKDMDLATGQQLPGADGTPYISEMALLCLRNHGLLSHWIADTLRHCIEVVSLDAETTTENHAYIAIASAPVDEEHPSKRARIEKPTTSKQSVALVIPPPPPSPSKLFFKHIPIRFQTDIDPIHTPFPHTLFTHPLHTPS